MDSRSFLPHKEVLPRLQHSIHSQILLRYKQQSPYCACMRRIISAGFTFSSNKKRITTLLSSLVQIDNKAAMLIGLLHSSDCKGRHVKCCMDKFFSKAYYKSAAIISTLFLLPVIANSPLL
ncbi:hypothetical protein TNCV_3459181 [Trichonephila clavipes]|nr:hypothetical protein TNCV_3459181 [Trichonephila clavipes]